MKKLLLTLALILPMIALNIEAKKKGQVELNTISSKVDGKPFENDSIAGVSFYKMNDSFITVIVRNRSNNKIFIEWDGSKVGYGKTIFDTDRPITMDSQPKTEETVYPGQSSNIKNISSRSKYMSSGLYPLYNEKELKKGNVENVKIFLPIRLTNGETRQYEYELQYKYVETEQ